MLDPPVVLLAESRVAQTELGERIDRRPAKMAVWLPATKLGKSVAAGEPRARHRRPKRRYKKRIRMPSMLDPHAVTIEGWLPRSLS